MFKNFLNFTFALLGIGADIVTVTSGTAGNSGNVAADLQTYFAAKLLEVAELNTILDQFGEKVPIPANSSKTVHFVREEKFSVSASPTQLQEGLPPDAAGLTMNQFEAVAEQYGFLVRISDLAELTAKHPVVQRTMHLLSLQAAEIYDQLIFNVLNASTQTYYPNSRAGISSLLPTDLPSYNDLTAIEAALQTLGARGIDQGGDYACIMAPNAYNALLRDPDWKASHQLVNPDKIWRGEVDSLAGFRIVRSNAPGFLPYTGNSVSGTATTVYSSFMVGRFAYQISDLQNLRVYVVAPGGQTDPLQQSRKLGWKFAFKAIITNNNWLYRYCTAGLDSAAHA
jgi:N4-gp56 family major capsid protein